MVRTCTFFVFVSLPIISGCSRPGQGDPLAFRQALDSMLVEHASVLTREDLDAAMDLYSADPTIRPNHATPQRGRENVRRFIEGWFKALNFQRVTYTTEEVAVFGDTAVAIGSVDAVVQPEGGAAVNDRGSYMVLLVKDSSGGWRSHRGVFNSSLPLAPPIQPVP